MYGKGLCLQGLGTSKNGGNEGEGTKKESGKKYKIEG
jgi:hypothetical protein